MAAQPVRTSSWRALIADPKHGPLPALLLVLTLVTGLVDAVSSRTLRRVLPDNVRTTFGLPDERRFRSGVVHVHSRVGA